MQPGAGLQGHRQSSQRRVVRHRKTHGVGGAVEQHQHTVGLVDLAAAPGAQQIARDTVVRGTQLGRGGIAQAFGKLGAVDHVGQQQGADVTHVGARAGEAPAVVAGECTDSASASRSAAPRSTSTGTMPRQLIVPPCAPAARW
jgi:hypothetical protein